MPTPANPADSQGTRPVPDPTVLTTEQLERAIGNLKELMFARMLGDAKHIDERFNGIRELFNGVRELQNLAERTRVEQKQDTAKELAAAFAAAKELGAQQAAAFTEATAKSEQTMTKQLDGLRDTFSAALAGINVSLAEIKERQTRTESLKAGGVESTMERRQSSTVTTAVIGVGISLILTALAIAGFIAANSGR